MSHTTHDWRRADRTGLPEVVFAASKTSAQLRDIAADHAARGAPMLITRMTPAQIEDLSDLPLIVDARCAAATYAAPPVAAGAPRLGVVTAGTSDLSVAAEVEVAARFLGLDAVLYQDIGVAGLWRLEEKIDELRTFPLLIAVAGMEGALFSVLAGLVRAPVIAVPTSVGYGVAEGGRAALSSALASCAPGVLTVNIDNGFGAAAAAAKMLLWRAPEPA